MLKKYKPPGLHASSLILKTRKLLNQDKRPLQDIAEKSGIPYFWIQSFKYERSQGYDANRVQGLYEFLSGAPLKC